MKEKERIYENIENLIRKSFYDNDGIIDVNKFESDFPVRSKCFWNIEHFLQYIKRAIEEA